MRERIKAAGHKAFFLLLLPLFFVLHGFTENYSLVPLADSIFLLLIYLVSMAVIVAIAYAFFRSSRKAALLGFFILSFHFFFGSWHDGMKAVFGNVFFTGYSFILPFSLVVFVLLFILLKRSKRSFHKAFLFMNGLLVLFILFDCISLAAKVSKEKNGQQKLAKIECDTCTRPDIYLIVADEYAGKEELKAVFQFDNSAFLSELSRRGFHTISESKSNYNFTPFSMASTLNMEFLDLKDPNHTIEDVPRIMELIKQNRFVEYLSSMGYAVYNNSVFDLHAEPSKTQATFLPLKTVYITSQTFLSRVKRDLSYHLITKFKLDWAVRKGMYTNNENNQLLYNNTLEVAKMTGTPKFSYTHLMLPHYPYYYAEDGSAYDYQSLTDKNSEQHYIGYLKYANKKYLFLIDQILKSSAKPPIIILMSDHGYRHSADSPNKDFSFSNLISVHLPNRNYEPFYQGMSNVNLLKTVLNVSFQQEFPLLKDSTTFLHD